jgi:hypothetical protein
MRINMFYIATYPQYGGFVTYTTHLVRALAAAGHDARLFMLKKKFHNTMSDLHGTPFRNVDIDFAIHCCKTAPTLITCTYWKQGPEWIEAMLKNGASIVIHDPNELKAELVEAVLKYKTKVVAIRKKNAESFTKLGMDVTFIPHPYIQAPEVPSVAKTRNACAISRVDFDKHTDIIVAANDKLLPASHELAVDIYGAENRMYVFHKLSKVCPHWKQYYKGAYPREEWAGVKTAAPYRYMVDMSLIKGDGGGTQYAFFEAWNANCALIIHDKWVLQGDDMKPGVNCISVDGAEALATTLAKRPPKQVIQGGLDMIAKHSSAAIAPQFDAFFKGSK